jgi:hypothetical protein
MEVKSHKPQMPILSTILIVGLVCITEYQFIESWHRHGPYTAGYGIFFIIVLGWALLSRLTLERKK